MAVVNPHAYVKAKAWWDRRTPGQQNTIVRLVLKQPIHQRLTTKDILKMYRQAPNKDI